MIGEALFIMIGLIAMIIGVIMMAIVTYGVIEDGDIIGCFLCSFFWLAVIAMTLIALGI